MRVRSWRGIFRRRELQTPRDITGARASSAFSPGLLATCAAVVALMANLSALVDLVLHPEIPYLDEEHLFVGGATALVSGVLIALALLYVHRYKSALRRIRNLESHLPICSHCKKVRTASTADRSVESWEPIDSYFTSREGVLFTHGVCPECMSEHYPEPDPEN